jgi:hypothetical protein
MSEEKKTEAPTEDKPDAAKVRDEKGLTVGNRLLLRAVLEERRIVMAAGRMSGDTSLYNSLTQDTLVDCLDDLLFYARLMGKRLGHPDELAEHLRKSEKADLAELRRMRDEIQETRQVERAEFMMGVAPLGTFTGGSAQQANCDVCGKPTCPSCGGCHEEHQKTNLN